METGLLVFGQWLLSHYSLLPQFVLSHPSTLIYSVKLNMSLKPVFWWDPSLEELYQWLNLLILVSHSLFCFPFLLILIVSPDHLLWARQLWEFRKLWKDALRLAARRRKFVSCTRYRVRKEEGRREGAGRQQGSNHIRNLIVLRNENPTNQIRRCHGQRFMQFLCLPEAPR